MGIYRSHNHFHLWYVHTSSLVLWWVSMHLGMCRLCWGSYAMWAHPPVLLQPHTGMSHLTCTVEITSRESAGLACIWAAKHMTALLHSSVPTFWSTSVSDVCRSASSGQLGLQSALLYHSRLLMLEVCICCPSSLLSHMRTPDHLCFRACYCR